MRVKLMIRVFPAAVKIVSGYLSTSLGAVYNRLQNRVRLPHASFIIVSERPPTTMPALALDQNTFFFTQMKTGRKRKRTRFPDWFKKLKNKLTLCVCVWQMYYSDKQGMLAADLSVYWGNDFYLESSKGLVGKWTKIAHKKKVAKMNMERSKGLECEQTN